jgi:cytochrome c heme-lyase
MWRKPYKDAEPTCTGSQTEPVTEPPKMSDARKKQSTQNGHPDVDAYEPLKIEYNVFAQPIDPKNQMPLNPNQLPSEGQTKPLPTDRVASTIPKGGTDDKTWQYPSEQMFYNALKRKGKADDVDEDDVRAIVAIHNNMNEKTWERVRQWEALHKSSCPEPRLSRFMGRPDDLTPLAWIKATLYPPRMRQYPFDRHDWFIDRCGKEVRYVIDYYHDEEKSPLDQMPKDQKDASAIKSIVFDARPALDSPGAFFDRLRMPIMEKLGMAPKLEPLRPAAAPERPAYAKPAPVDFSKADEPAMKKYSDTIQSKCRSVREALQNCGQDENQCRKLSVSLFHCMSTVVCPDRAKAYEVDVASEAKFDDILECMSAFEGRAREVFRKQN